MKKLKYYKTYFKLWNVWRKKTYYNPWKKFLVLIGRKHSPVLNGMLITEGFKEGMYEMGKAAKKASASVDEMVQALRDKLGVVSPSRVRMDETNDKTD